MIFGSGLAIVVTANVVLTTLKLFDYKVFYDTTRNSTLTLKEAGSGGTDLGKCQFPLQLTKTALGSYSQPYVTAQLQGAALYLYIVGPPVYQCPAYIYSYLAVKLVPDYVARHATQTVVVINIADYICLCSQLIPTRYAW